MSRTTDEHRRYRMALGALIRKEREAAGVTQKELEKRTNIPQSTISAIEKGERQGATTEQVAVIAAALGIGVDRLMPAPVMPEQTPEPAPVPPPAAPMSAWHRKLSATREAFLARFGSELGKEDIKHVNAVTFSTDPGIQPDEAWWWDTVESGRRRRARARGGGGDGGKAPP